MKVFKSVLFLIIALLMLVSAVPFASASDSEKAESYSLTVEHTYTDSSVAHNAAFGGVSFFGSAEFDGSYGNQLTGTAKEIYNSLVKSFVKNKNTGAFTHIFKTPFTFEAEVSLGFIVKNDALEEVDYIIGCSVQTAMDAFLYDHPEVFWLKLIYSSYNISAVPDGGGYTGIVSEIEIIPVEIYNGASAKLSGYEAAVSSALKEITVTESRKETLEAVHDYICNNAYYNLVNEQRVHSSEPFFIGDGGVVCEGYAKAFKVICDRLGIPCVLVCGDAGGPHMWNYVQMDDGKWYLIDATWDDQDDKIYYTYFIANSGTKGFDGITISRERSLYTDFSGAGIFSFTYPVLATTEYVEHVHKWSAEYTVDVEPTCTEKGSKSIHCTLCTMKKDVTEIPAAEHQYGLTLTPATVNADGIIVYSCHCGDVEKTKTIAKIDSVTLSATDYIYDGKNKTPKVTVKDANGKTLVKNTDYKLTVASKRSGIGRYTVKVTFIGNYSGTKNVYFYIKTGKPETVKSASQTTSSVKLSWSAVPGAAGYTVYRYSPSKKAYVKAGTTEGTSLTVSKLYTGTKYTFRVVSYGKTSAGKVYDSDTYALLKTATKTKTPELTKVTASSTKGKAYVYHSDVSGETGYTVYYSTSKDSGFKKYANFKADTTRCDITGLTSGKTYYFKVRTYIKTDSGYVYSAWSAVKGIKVK